jgi:hypothetical protein
MPESRLSSAASPWGFETSAEPAEPCIGVSCPDVWRNRVKALLRQQRPLEWPLPSET